MLMVTIWTYHIRMDISYESPVYTYLGNVGIGPFVRLVFKCARFMFGTLSNSTQVAHGILPTLQITLAECRWLLNTLLDWATMTSKRESWLALMDIHYSRQVDISSTVDIFIGKHPRRILLAYILAEVCE